MYIIKKIEQYNDNYIYFCDPIKNNIMQDGTFTRIIYSNMNIVFNGIYLKIPLADIFFEKYYNKYKCNININNANNKEIFEKIKNIEEVILKKHIIENSKTPIYKIYDQLRNNNIKFFCDFIPKYNSTLILKISGIWETLNHFGLTYKFIIVNHP